MQLISGTQMAAAIRQELCRQNGDQGVSPLLAVMLVGKQEDSCAYVKLKQKAAAEIGGQCRVVHLAEDISASQLLAEIATLNQDPQVDGIILQLPLPAHLQPRQDEFLQAIAPQKDVDGFNPVNRGLLIGGQPRFNSCAALAAMEVISRYLPELKGRNALLIGDSFDLILPLTTMLVKQGCEVRVIPEWDKEAAISADIVVAEKGAPQIIKKHHLGRVRLLIDAGWYWTSKGSRGNVDNEDVAVADGLLLPVPGGMGPLLIAELMYNLSRAAWEQQGVGS
jgi:methylenetetrahydrofolate dehydrogenase (NADP+)/methenyltetrahydrofolate cyclohydrolase